MAPPTVMLASATPAADIAQVAYQVPQGSAGAQPVLAPPPSSPLTAGEGDPGNANPFAGGVLRGDELVAEVQRRNPSLRAASAAWCAAAQRYPQVVSLEDPMFGFLVSPAGIGSGGPQGENGYMLEASQKVPWPGKRALRGEAAAQEAEAAKGEIGVTRLRLAEAAKIAFFDYYQARRELEVNASTAALMQEFRDIARQKYEASQATVQDVLQAEVEIAELAGRRAELVRDDRVAMARINTLLHRAADGPLPPPPAEMPPLVAIPPVTALQERAIQARPDLFARGARIREEEANLALAGTEYYPDMEFVFRYDANMMEPRIRPMVGMNMNVPLYHAKRDAAVREAQARLQQRRAELNEQIDQVRFEVQSAVERLNQGRDMLQLYSQRILPTADESLRAARANYTSGRLDFLRLLDAERTLYLQRERYFQALGDYHRRLAELERAVGEPF